MAGKGEHSGDSIRQAASESVSQGEGVRERVRDLTLGALTSRRFDREAIREVVRAITEGVSLGAAGSGAGAQRSVAEAFRGMDQALAGLQKIEEDFVATVGQVADSASERVRPELREALGQATRAGTETSRQVAATMTDLTRTFASASAEFTLAGIEMAGEFGARFAQIAGGVLAGMADALDKPSAEMRAETKKSS